MHTYLTANAFLDVVINSNHGVFDVTALDCGGEWKVAYTHGRPGTDGLTVLCSERNRHGPRMFATLDAAYKFAKNLAGSGAGFPMLFHAQ